MSKLSHEEKGNAVASHLWEWLHVRQETELVPWVKDAGRIVFDAGYKQCLKDVINEIESKAHELNLNNG